MAAGNTHLTPEAAKAVLRKGMALRTAGHVVKISERDPDARGSGWVVMLDDNEASEPATQAKSIATALTTWRTMMQDEAEAAEMQAEADVAHTNGGEVAASVEAAIDAGDPIVVQVDATQVTPPRKGTTRKSTTRKRTQAAPSDAPKAGATKDTPATPAPPKGRAGKGKDAPAPAHPGESIEARVARMAKEDLPPVPSGEGPVVTTEPAAPSGRRSASGLSRIAAGRMRSRATAHVYRVSDEQFAKHAEKPQIVALQDAIAKLDAVIDGVSIDATKSRDAAEREAYDRVSECVHAAWTANVPTTVIGHVIGSSGGSARGRALVYAAHTGTGVPKGVRAASVERAPQKPSDAGRIRYADALAPLYAAVTAKKRDEAEVDTALASAFVAGLPVTAMAKVAGLSQQDVRKRAVDHLRRHGQDVPTEQARREARLLLPLAELPDD